MAKSTGLAIIELATQFEILQPDFVITVADRFESLATAIAASYMNIRLAHTQGGESTGSIDESVRHAVSKLSHLHFPATDRAAETLFRFGESRESVFRTGCPSIDVLRGLDLSVPEDIFRRYGGVGPELNPHLPYLVVVQHPVTTEYGLGREQIEETLKAIDALSMPAVWLWPNVDAGSDDISKRLREYRERSPSTRIHFFRNFSVEDYARLLNGCACLVGNSSSGLREAGFLGVPAVNIGSRQQGRERAGNVIDVPHDSVAIANAITRQLEHGQFSKSLLYGDGTAGRQIADILSTVDIPIQKRLTY